MIKGIGIDIIQNGRFKKENLNNLVNMILTDKEKKIFDSYNQKKQMLFLSGRFAAKEAIIKAVSDLENPHMLEIEILNNSNGKPIVKFKDYNILVSISHEKDYAIAEAILISN